MRRRGNWILPLLIVVITFVAFIPALRAGFVSWDDERNFLTNPHYRGLGLAQLRWMWSTFLLGHYVPITWMTLGADYLLWGMNPAGYHLTNVLFHCANALLVYAVALRLLPQAVKIGDGEDALLHLSAGCAALVFAIHPLRVESVAWITERRDVVSGFFCLLTVLLYLRAVDSGVRRTGAYWAAVVAFICALLSKGTSVTVPAALLILNIWPLRRIGGSVGWLSVGARRVIAEMIPFAVPAMAIMVLSVVALHPPDQLPWSGKIAVSAYSLVFYLYKTLLPTTLSPLYSMPVVVDPTAGMFVVAYGGILILAVLAYFSWRRWPGLLTALTVFTAVSLPMLGIVQNGPQIAADRYTYHSAPALALLAGAAVILLARRFSPRVASSIAGVLLLVLAVATWRQNGVWRDSEHLWTRVLDVEPDSPLGNSAWANLMYKANRLPEAIEFSKRAVDLAPQFAEGHNDLGVGYAKTGHVPEAIGRYQQALALKPGYDEAENNWGVVLAQSGQLDSAVAHYQRALASNPENPDAEVNWGNVLVRAGRTAEAIEHYKRALWIRGDNADAHHDWGVALARDGDFAGAIAQFEAALAIDPDHAEAREYLAKARELLKKRQAGTP